MSGFIPKEKLTAYQRWELAAFDEAEQTRTVTTSTDAASATNSTEEDEGTAVKLPTASEIEQIHTEAHEAGYAAGYEEGLTLARAEVEKLVTLGVRLHENLNALDQEIAEELLSVAVEIAGQVLRQSLKIQPEMIIPVVREAVAALPLHHGHPALFLNPEDAAIVREHMSEQLNHNGWRILEDSSIETGGCRIESGASEVDATLETRWKRVLDAIGTSSEWLQSKT